MADNIVVVIVSFRQVADVAACLSALARQTQSGFDVIICENGDEAALAALRAELPARLPGGQGVRIIADHTNPGYAGAINRCMSATADAPAWWVLNPDTLPEPDALAHLSAALVAGADAVGGTILAADGGHATAGGKWHAWAARAVALPAPGNGNPRPVPPARVDYLSGASFLVSRAFVERNGPLREEYFLYAEEVEWFVRARRRGLAIAVEPQARVMHAQGTATGSGMGHRERPRMPIHLDERNKLLVVRDTQPWLLPIAIPASLAFAVARYAPRGAWRQLGYALSGWWDGLCNRRGKPDYLVRPTG